MRQPQRVDRGHEANDRQSARPAYQGVRSGTILPIENGTKYTPENEGDAAGAVNKWIRTSGEYDGVFDFEKVVADPKDPLTIRSDLTPDHVHPNSVGYRMMADSIDLKVFE